MVSVVSAFLAGQWDSFFQKIISLFSFQDLNFFDGALAVVGTGINDLIYFNLLPCKEGDPSPSCCSGQRGSRQAWR